MAGAGRQSALITGGAKRIGGALARALGEDGWHIVIHCNRSRTEAAATAAAIEAAGGSAEIVTADLSDPEAAAGLIARVSRTAPPLTTLINNASLFLFDTIETLTPAMLDRHFAVNLRAPLLITQSFLANLGASLGAEERGCIINMLDNKIVATNPDYLSYTVTKFGLHGATLTLALAAAPRVRVNAIAPGITLASDGQGQASFEKSMGMSPTGKVSSLADIVRAARFILATESLNGQLIVVDGGQALQNLPRDVAFLGPDESGDTDQGGSGGGGG